LTDAQQPAEASLGLIVAMFEDLRTGQRATDERLDSLSDRVGKLDSNVEKMGELQATQNGNVAHVKQEQVALQAWQAAHDVRERHVADLAAGAKKQREEYVRKVTSIRTFLADYWPRIVGTAFVLASVANWVWVAVR
jgi:TolA-binding protein